MPDGAVGAVHVAVYLGIALVWPPQAPGFAAAVAAALVWASVTDWQRYEIPDAASALLVVLGAVWWALQFDEPGFEAAVAGAVLWPLAAWGVAAAYQRFRGWPGLGFGDVKLLSGIGLWAGFEATVWVVLCTALAGIGAILLRNARSRGRSLATEAIAFGPFLCLSA